MKTGNRHIGFLCVLAGLLLSIVAVPIRAELPPASFYQLKRDIDVYSSGYCTIAEDKYGFLWFGSVDGGGLYRYDGYDIKSFLPDPGNLSGSVSGSRVINVNCGLDSLICVGTTFGLSLINPKTGHFRNYNNGVEDIVDQRLGVTLTFLPDSVRNLLWVGTRFGLAQVSLDNSMRFTSLRPETLQPGERTPNDVMGIAFDKSDFNRLWIATTAGLFSYDVQKRQYQYVSPSFTKEDLALISLYQDPTGKLWFGTRAREIITYDPATATWGRYPVTTAPSEDGRTDVYNLLPDRPGTMWIAAHNTVGKLDLETGIYEGYYYNPEYPDGLLQNGFYRGILGDRHGRLWIASWHGVQYAKRAFLQPSNNVQDPRVAIVGVERTPVFEDDAHAWLYTDAISLRKEQRDVVFQFVLPNPLDPGRVEYQYKLEGYDKDWITTDQRRARYTRLSGGKYKFIVRAREGEAKDWLPVTELDINIALQVTEMWWFWALMVLLISLIAVIVYRLLLSNARKRERMKSEYDHKLSEIQMQALRAQMNPHFLFNSLNSIKYFAISKSKDETAAYLSKFALLVRSILNNSKSRTISLQDELDALRLYIEIEHLRLEGKFDYAIEIDSGIHIQQAQIPPMILQPFVENAIWHGLMHKDGKGRLLVQVRDLGSQIQCVIEDNGIGRARAAEIRKAQMDHKKSVGMQITSDRIALINRIYHIDTQVHVIDLTTTDGTAAGTRVVINIPLIREED